MCGKVAMHSSRVWKHEGANDSAVDTCMKRPLLIALQSASY